MFQVFRNTGGWLLPYQVRREDEGGQRERERESFYISSGADSSVWQKDTRKYAIAQTYESQAMCSVVVASKLIKIPPLNN